MVTGAPAEVGLLEVQEEALVEEPTSAKTLRRIIMLAPATQSTSTSPSGMGIGTRHRWSSFEAIPRRRACSSSLTWEGKRNAV